MTIQSPKSQMVLTLFKQKFLSLAVFPMELFGRLVAFV